MWFMTYEDDKVLAFRDIAPQAPIHILIIPKVKDRLTGLSKAEERHCEILGYLLYTARLVAKQEGLDDGFRIVINDGPKGCLYSILSVLVAAMTGKIKEPHWRCFHFSACVKKGRLEKAWEETARGRI